MFCFSSRQTIHDPWHFSKTYFLKHRAGKWVQKLLPDEHTVSCRRCRPWVCESPAEAVSEDEKEQHQVVLRDRPQERAEHRIQQNQIQDQVLAAVSLPLLKPRCLPPVAETRGRRGEGEVGAAVGADGETALSPPDTETRGECGEDGAAAAVGGVGAEPRDATGVAGATGGGSTTAGADPGGGAAGLAGGSTPGSVPAREEDVGAAWA